MRLLLAVVSVATIALSFPAHAQQVAPKHAVDVSLSAAAAGKLSTLGETVTVSSTYSGDAKPDVESEEGFIWLGEDLAVLEGSGMIEQGGKAFEAGYLEKTTGEPHVLINVFSSRTKLDDNLLDCGIFESRVSQVPSTPIPISCKLIGE